MRTRLYRQLIGQRFFCISIHILQSHIALFVDSATQLSQSRVLEGWWVQTFCTAFALQWLVVNHLAGLPSSLVLSMQKPAKCCQALHVHSGCCQRKVSSRISSYCAHPQGWLLGGSGFGCFQGISSLIERSSPNKKPSVEGLLVAILKGYATVKY